MRAKDPAWEATCAKQGWDERFFANLAQSEKEPWAYITDDRFQPKLQGGSNTNGREMGQGGCVLVGSGLRQRECSDWERRNLPGPASGVGHPRRGLQPAAGCPADDGHGGVRQGQRVKAVPAARR